MRVGPDTHRQLDQILMDEKTPPILAAQALTCSRVLDRSTPSRVRDLSLVFEEKTTTLIWGEEGCGKNLLLRLLGLMETPDGGEVLLRGMSMGLLSEEARAVTRNEHFGFLFAAPFLLPSFSLLENVAMPLFKISSVNTEQARRRTQTVLDFVGLGGHAHSAVDELPLPDQHRASLARALVNWPEILLVENLDASLHGGEPQLFLELFQRAAAEFGTTTIITAADAGLARFADRGIAMAEGRVVHDDRTIPADHGAKV
jgi:lipoprotein-releasing system ATP-binding protein